MLCLCIQNISSGHLLILSPVGSTHNSLSSYDAASRCMDPGKVDKGQQNWTSDCNIEILQHGKLGKHEFTSRV